MTDLLKKLLDQGLPTMLFVLGALSLAFGFFAFEFSPSFRPVLRPYIPLIAIAVVLLGVSIGLWFLDRKKQVAAERYLDGHYNLIRFLVCFVEAHDHRMPEAFSEALLDDNTHSTVAHRAARYAAMYLHVLGFLTPNVSGSEYIASKKAQALIGNNNDFRARNLDAFHKRGA